MIFQGGSGPPVPPLWIRTWYLPVIIATRRSKIIPRPKPACFKANGIPENNKKERNIGKMLNLDDFLFNSLHAG